MREELIRGGERPQSALAEPGEIGPVDLVEVDGAIVRAPAQRDARGLVERFALRQLESAEQVIVQRQTQVGSGRISRVGGSGSLRLIESARRARGSEERRVG